MLPHETRLKLSDWFDDLSVRFLVNLPDEELQDASRICFQIEEAHWFYEDFVREESPDLPSMNMRQFAYEIMAHCPLLETWPEDLRVSAFEAFIAYKARVPVRGGILLNHDMTEVVLVKGWKKSAKWSFPRGKLNKEEHDLVCAVREVYEETGYDLKQAGLVAPEEDMKSIQVPIREQDIKLFVFRGVPKDTYFAPRTRKEISDIQWYKLSDLPTQKRKNAMQQTQAQQNAAQDKRGNSFYMVAPFLGPLKAWIRQQRKLDRERAGLRGAPQGIVSGLTDAEDVDAGETTADDAPTDDASARYLQHPRQNIPPRRDAVDEMIKVEKLKNILQIPGLPSFPPSAPQLLRPENQHPRPVPHAPVHPDMPTPEPPRNLYQDARMPHLANEHAFQAPPPHPFSPFEHPPSFDPTRHSSLVGPPPPNVSHPSNTLPKAIHPMFPPGAGPSNRQHASSLPAFITHAPHIPQPTNERLGAPLPPQGSGIPEFPGVHGPVIPSGSNLPPPRLTPQALNLLSAFKSPAKVEDKMAHAASFGSPDVPPQPLAEHGPPSRGILSTPRATQNTTRPVPAALQPVPSSHTMSPIPPPRPALPGSIDQSAQSNPLNAHQGSLLNLFKSTTLSAGAPPPPKDAGPAELSAYPSTPGHMNPNAPSSQGGPPLSPAGINAEPASRVSQMPELTSATVSGPVNVPDFDTVKKRTHASPVSESIQRGFAPQILKRPGQASRTRSPAEGRAPSSNASPAPAPSSATPEPKAFQPRILKRPQQTVSPSPLSAPVPRPVPSSVPAQHNAPEVPPHPKAQPPTDTANISTPIPATREPVRAAPTTQSFDRRASQTTAQKDALLSLFGKPTQPSGAPIPTSNPAPSGGFPHKSPQFPSPFPASPQPPSPRSLVPAVMSPVSPLRDVGNSTDSPAMLANRSRISSIGETTIPTAGHGYYPQINTAAAPIPLGAPLGMPYASHAQSGGQHTTVHPQHGLTIPAPPTASAASKATSPVDTEFLRGFLENVARGGR